VRRERGPLRAVAGFLASYGLSCFLLGVLFVLTFVGTYYQREHGLYAAQKRFFESMFVDVSVGSWRVPILPGGSLAMALLAVNLFFGGLVRIRKTWNTLGIIVVHVGIALMLAAGLVKYKWSDDGYLRLFEGEQADEFVSFYKWEIAIFDADTTGETRELLIPHEEIVELGIGEPRAFLSDDLPFDLVLSDFVPNCSPAPKGPMWESALPVVDGWALRPMPWQTDAENNVAGVYATATDADGSIGSSLLWGLERAPWTFESGGKRWAVTLRHKRYSLPWTIRLEDFTKEDHPRIDMPKSFMSDVSRIEAGEETPVRIQMNEPMRKDGMILFQASWGPQNARPGDPLFSQFSVVRNPSDYWPLISCIIIAVGMLLAFAMKLRRYLRDQTKRRQAVQALEGAT
jgi:hypothetical protein